MMKMKRTMKINQLMLLGGMLLAFNACKEEELVFPKNVDSNIEVTEKRPTARPTNLTMVSTFNQKIEIYWPLLSDRVSKAVISYVEGADKKVLEVTKFDEPTIIALEEVKAHRFELQYFTTDGASSKKTIAELTPKPFEVSYRLDNMRAEKVEGGVQIVFPKTLERSLSYKVAYQVEGVAKEKLMNGVSIDTIVINKLFDQTKLIDFTVSIVDAELNKSGSKVLQMSPGILPYKTIIPSFLFNTTGAKTGAVTWTNDIEEIVTVQVDYVSDGVPKSVKIANDLVAGILPLNMGNQFSNLTVKLTGKEGTSVLFSPLSEYGDQSSWKISVSDEQPGDGGGAAALIDKNVETFWHSQYDPEIAFPHWFLIDFGKQKPLAKISMMKRSGQTNGFIIYNIEVSLDGTNYKQVANDLTFDPTADKWQDYLFPSIVDARFVRITMTKPKNDGDNFTHLGEFRAFGY